MPARGGDTGVAAAAQLAAMQGRADRIERGSKVGSLTAGRGASPSVFAYALVVSSRSRTRSLWKARCMSAACSTSRAV